METKTKLKSSTAYLFNCYIWLLNTIARGPISRAAIDEKWAHSSVNEYKQDYLPESNFHRWKSTVEMLFDVHIKCNAYNEYYIEEASDLRGADLRLHLLNLMSIDSLLKDSKELSDRILFEPVPSGEKFLPPIIEAMRDKTAIEMTYQSFTRQKPATFIVEPYCLKVFKQRWYMLAYSPGLDKAMIYSLGRVHAVEPTKQKYKLPKDFNAEAYFKNTYGVTGMDEEPEDIEICIDAMQANYLRTLPLHSSQEEIERNDDYSIFRFHMVPSYEFLQELRKYGSDVEVISPESVRAEFREDTESLYRIYKQMESWV
ncbi:MAG: WYL domain-containing protein [Paludibacteraceae bacterium]|nr:WYL domain-containing protein [Paludibacteraceae bacterium]